VYGETIASSSSVSSAVNSWIPSSLSTLNFTLDASGFKFTSQTNLDPGEFLVTLSKVPQFTQLVWKSSTSVGCGRMRCSTKWIVVCEYWPKGNELSVVAANVQGAVVSKSRVGKSGEIGESSDGVRLEGWRVAIWLEMVVFSVAVLFL